MYRLLRANQEVRERRDLARHPNYSKPELLATAPRQVFTWDIAELRGPVKGSMFHLFVMRDIFCYYVVGWTVANRENAKLAAIFIAETMRKEGIAPGQVLLHADRGKPMIAKPIERLLDALGVVGSHSRPHVSDDNPFSEARFKTLKYHPTFPDRFGSQEDAKALCESFFTAYNNEHRHSGIALLTPAMVHHGEAGNVLAARATVLATAYDLHPERFVRGKPAPEGLPPSVRINPPTRITPRRNAHSQSHPAGTKSVDKFGVISLAGCGCRIRPKRSHGIAVSKGTKPFIASTATVYMASHRGGVWRVFFASWHSSYFADDGEMAIVTKVRHPNERNDPVR